MGLKADGKVSIRRYIRPESLNRMIRDLGARSVYVGVLKENNKRESGGITNAALAYIHENGSETSDPPIPARPFLRMGLLALRASGQLQAISKAAVLSATKKDNLDQAKVIMESALNEIGALALESVKNTLLAGVPPALKEETIRKRRARGNYNTTPLYDTHQLYNSLGYLIRKKKGAS